MSRDVRFAIMVLGLVVAFPRTLAADPPPGYYDSVDTTNAATLRATLHAVIDDHTRYPYTSSSTDTWNILESAQQDPNNANNIIDVYRNRSHAKIGGGTGPYNREHSWPKSYGFPDDGSSNYPYTDCYQLFLCDSGYNSARSNKPFRYCNASCSEKTTDSNNGQGGGSGGYPGNSNWTSGSLTQGSWETWIGRRGDVARAQFYLDVRYEGGTHGITGVSEPDLILTDNESLIAASNTGNNESVAYMGIMSVLIQWHHEDPVDDWERNRNDVVSSYQGNRNPFIDHPEWVDCLFSSNCGTGGTPPAMPTGLVANGGTGIVMLDWNDNAEPDLNGYRVYRSSTSGGPYTQISGGLVPTSDYDDTSVSGGTTYHYVVTAVNTIGQGSSFSTEAIATTQGGGGGVPGPPWINEFHYDNSGGDTGEFLEIAGPAGTDLSGWRVYGYNGNGGGTYKNIGLSGVIPDQGGCMGTLGFAFSSMQNGSPDGLALVDPGDAVVQFISYEGSLNAIGGPANGMTSVNVGVSESSSTPVGHSLRLSGTGKSYADFTWQSPSPNSQGTPNAGQSFEGCIGDTIPPDAPTGLEGNGDDMLASLAWAENGEMDLAGYNLYRATTAGGPYTQVNGSLLTSNDFIDSGLTNCTPYYYVVTAVDDSGNESNDSAEISILPETDTDLDGTSDCDDLCPTDQNKTEPGACGCGTPDTPANGDLNDDGLVDSRDIQVFASALTSGQATPLQTCRGDFDGNTLIGTGDIPGMVAGLLGP